MRTVIVAAAVLACAGRAEAFGVGGARGGVRVGPGGAAAGRSFGGAAVGPLGGLHAGGARGGTYVGPGGTTVQAGRAGGVGVGPLGGVHAGGAQGVRVTTPGGQTYTSGSVGGAARGPLGGVRVGGATGAAAAGPWGGAAVGSRGVAGVTPWGTAGAYRAGGVAVGHTTTYMSPNTVRMLGATARTGFTGATYFSPTWYAVHRTAWVAPRWTVANVWAPVTFATAAAFVGAPGPPVVYDYGSTVVINDDRVYVNGDDAGTAADYAAQASTLADAGRAAAPPDADAWQPLGVFGLLQGDEAVAQRIFQLAVNKAGVVRGNYYDAVADNTLPVYGSVDPKAQRVAWSIGDKKDVVFETGLKNLTEDQTTLLVHFGKDKTQQMVLARLEQPAGAGK
jgi:hypothetical protein